MTISRLQISAATDQYLAAHPGERDSLAPLLTSLAVSRDLDSRHTLPGHVTCSALVIGDDGLVLVIRHLATGRWLLPGGHLEPGDASLAGAALRELAEETGLQPSQVRPVAGLADTPADIDVHAIAASPAKGEAAHWHADFRWAFTVAADAVAVRLQECEVDGYGWRAPSALHTEGLAARAAALAAR